MSWASAGPDTCSGTMCEACGPAFGLVGIPSGLELGRTASSFYYDVNVGPTRVSGSSRCSGVGA